MQNCNENSYIHLHFLELKKINNEEVQQKAKTKEITG